MNQKVQRVIADNECVADLVDEALKNAGHPNPSFWRESKYSKLNEDALKEDTNQDIQRFLVNRQLRLVIAGMPSDTKDARFCLVEQGTIHDWYRLLEDGVIPKIMEHAETPAE